MHDDFNHPKHIWPILGLIAVVIIIVWLFSFFGSRETTPVVEQEQVIEEIAPGQERVTPVEEGVVVASFPEELILEDSPSVQRSYAINYNEEDLQQPVVRYLSELSLAENVTLYGDYLAANAWRLLREGDANAERTTTFYGTKDNTELQVVFVVTESGVIEVTLAYVLKN